MTGFNIKKVDNDVASHIERIYDDVVMYCLHRKTFNSELLCKVFELDEYTCNELITTMIINRVIGDVSDGGVYQVSDKYVHSDFLAIGGMDKNNAAQIKNDKKESGGVGRYFAFLALIVFFVSIYFLFRSPMSLLLLIPISLIIVAGSDKVGTVASSIVVIIVCIFSLIFVNSSTPIFGEKYEARVKAENYKDRIRKEAIEEMNQISFGEKRLKNSLKDPSSADIRNSKLGKSGVVCGQVNAKNSFGAYTGYKNFVQIGTTSLIDDGTKDFANEWNNLCN
ncbi:TPA: hypothetical protein ACKROV_001958 [Providencia alcalifaciens]